MAQGAGNGRLLVWFSLGHLANDWGPSAIWLITPAIAASFELSPARVGLLITIVSLGAALGYLPAGLLADQTRNRGRLLLATFWWVAIGYALASFAPGFWTLAALLAIAGLGDAAWHPIATGALAQALPRRRAQAIGIHAMGGTFAEVLAPLVVGVLLVYLDWRGVLLVSALPAALLGLAFLRVAAAVPPAPRQAPTRADLAALWAAWRRPQGLLMVAIICLYNMALLAILSMTPLFLQRVHGLAPSAVGGAFAVMVLAGALAQPWIGRYSDRIGRKPVFIAGNLLAVASAVAAAFLPAAMAAIVALIVAVGALYGIRSAVLAAAVEFAGGREGLILGMTFALLDGVGALGAVAAGIAGNTGLPFAFLLAAGFAAAAAAIAGPAAFQATARAAAPGTGAAGRCS